MRFGGVGSNSSELSAEVTRQVVELLNLYCHRLGTDNRFLNRCSAVQLVSGFRGMSRDATAVHVGRAGVVRLDGDVDPGPSCGLPFFIPDCLNRFTTRARFRWRVLLYRRCQAADIFVELKYEGLGCNIRETPPGRIEITSTPACDSVSCGILLSVLNAVVVSTARAAEITFRMVLIQVCDGGTTFPHGPTEGGRERWSCADDASWQVFERQRPFPVEISVRLRNLLDLEIHSASSFLQSEQHYCNSHLRWRTLPYRCCQPDNFGELGYEGLFAWFCSHRLGRAKSERQ